MADNINADMWKSIACDLNNARADAGGDAGQLGADELWNEIFLKMEQRMNMYSRDFSSAQFRMLAGYKK